MIFVGLLQFLIFGFQKLGILEILNFHPCIYFYIGGTCDITVHEVMEDGNVREVYKANGGPWGGTKINDAFVSLLEGWCSLFWMTEFLSTALLSCQPNVTVTYYFVYNC